MEMRKKISIEVEDKVMEDLVSIILRKTFTYRAKL